MKALTPLKKYLGLFWTAPCLKAVECVCELSIPFIVRAIIDEGLTLTGSHYMDSSFVLLLCLLVFGLSLFGFCCTMVTQFIASDVTAKFALGVKRNIYAQMQSLTPLQLEQYGKSKALNLMNTDAFSLQTGVQMFMRLLVRAPFLALGSIVCAFIVNPYAGLVVLGSLLLCAAVIVAVVLTTPKKYRGLVSDLDDLSRLGGDGISGSRVIRAFNRQEATVEEFEKKTEEYRHHSVSLAKINALVNPLTFGLVNLAIVLILFLGGYKEAKLGISMGSIVALISFLTQSLAALIQFTRLVTSFSKALAAKKRIDEFLALVPAIQDGPKEAFPPLQDGDLIYELKDASVSFGGENNALNGINFSVAPGQKIGIIGGTGSGKSTLLSLLLRYMDPVSGQVLFHGAEIQSGPLKDVRKEVALVSQKPQFFKGTIRQNILLGQEEDEARLWAALDDAMAGDFVRDKGLDAPVEERGSNLSGGQKQRLLIARALYAQRPVLILDDATSALDYKTDKKVRENIAKRKGITLIMVSQRATSVRDCDEIYVLDQGQIAGKGKHEELLSSCPIYADIYQAQVQQS